MCVCRSVVGAEDGRVTVLGLWRVDIRAAHLAVRAVHHLHKLATSRGQSRPASGPRGRAAGSHSAERHSMAAQQHFVMDGFKIMLTNFNTNKRLGLCSNRPG